jgi:hypothetical protein
MKENRIVPDSLADLLITLTVSGYYDSTLRDAIDHAPRRPMALTTWLSGHQSFPDAYYRFNQSGRMEWQATPDLLALRGSADELRNLGVLCVPAERRPELGRLMCSYPIEFEIDAAANLTVLRVLPTITLTTDGLTLDATVNMPAGAVVTVDFGDGTGLADASAFPHVYAKPGRYEALIRIAVNQRLTEYRVAVVVSRQHAVQPPCIAVPSLTATAVSGKVKLEPTLNVPGGETLAVTWRVDGRAPEADGNPPSFTLEPGRHILRFTAIRPLAARFYGHQRYDPTVAVPLDGLHVATNRTFDSTTGTENTASLNQFGQHVFGGRTLAPTDRWTLELPLEDNTCLVSVSNADARQYYLGELADMFLTLEYTIKGE